MKKLLVGIAATMAVTGAASAADLGGSIKDDPGYANVPAIWTGWVVTGGVGIANQNFDTRRTITGELNKFSIDRKVPDRTSEDDWYCRDEGVNDSEVTSETAIPKPIFGGCPDGFVNRKVNSEPELAVFGADDTIDPARYEIPLASSDFGRSEELDSSGFQGGVELGRRVQSGGLIWEGAIGVNFDAAGSTTSSYDTVHAITIDPAGLFGGPFPIDPDDAALTGEGTLSLKKKRDIYAVIGLGVPLGSDQRFAVGGRGGLVLGFFDINGSHSFDGDDDGTFDTAFSESETAIGGVFEAYARYKIDANWDFGLIGSYKIFRDIKAGDSAEKDFPFGNGDKGLVARVNDRVTVDPSEWALKGTLTYAIQ